MKFTAELKKQMVNYDLPAVAITKFKTHHSTFEINRPKIHDESKYRAWIEMALYIFAKQDWYDEKFIENEGVSIKFIFGGLDNTIELLSKNGAMGVHHFGNTPLNMAEIEKFVHRFLKTCTATMEYYEENK
jgi:hypothetical protein